MKEIEVVAAVIKENDRVFVTQRGYGEFKGQWEFPGGKIEEGEKNEEALVREIKEELNVLIDVKDYLCTVNHTYSTFELKMHCYLCNIVEGTIKLLEHDDAKWLCIEELDDLDWLEADIEVLKHIKL